MDLLNISDDDIDFNSSKWLLEYARIVGCDRFSFDIFDFIMLHLILGYLIGFKVK